MYKLEYWFSLREGKKNNLFVYVQEFVHLARRSFHLDPTRIFFFSLYFKQKRLCVQSKPKNCIEARPKIKHVNLENNIIESKKMEKWSKIIIFVLNEKLQLIMSGLNMEIWNSIWVLWIKWVEKSVKMIWMRDKVRPEVFRCKKNNIDTKHPDTITHKVYIHYLHERRNIYSSP